MKFFVCWVAAVVMLTGCAGPKPKPTGNATAGDSNGKSSPPKVIVTPEAALVGKVSYVDVNARFAVVNFPVGTMPGLGQPLNVYRQGLKVGEVKVSGPRDDDNVVADITVGEVKVGDDLRPD